MFKRKESHMIRKSHNPVTSCFREMEHPGRFSQDFASQFQLICLLAIPLLFLYSQINLLARKRDTQK